MAAETQAGNTYEPPADERGIVRHTLHYAWQDQRETPDERQALLAGIRDRIREQALAHFQCGENRVLVIASPPGTGKSTAVAELGAPGGPYHLNLAWVCERHAMVAQVPGLAAYRHIQPCSEANCADWQVHRELARRGCNTWAIHKRHAEPCEYQKQFERSGDSAIYQLQHVLTTYPVQHEAGIVVDECNLSNWLDLQEYSQSDVAAAHDACEPDPPAQALLRALAVTLQDAWLTKQELTGPEVVHTLDAHCAHQLASLVHALEHDPRARNEHPLPDVDLATLRPLVVVSKQAPVVLPHVWKALNAELAHIQQRVRWNSHLRAGPARKARGGWSLYITQPRTFTPGDAPCIPPRVILDATADADLMGRLLDAPVQVSTVELDPPPHMQHIAVRVAWSGGIKHYSKTSLTWEPNSTRLARAIAEVQAVLEPLDPDGARRAAGDVGLITFDDCEQAMAAALGIRYVSPTAPEAERQHGRSGHFWAERGSNRFRDCSILLVVGTPVLPVEAVYRMASVLYAADDTPLVLQTYKDEHSVHHYCDPRCQHLSDYLTRAELTQCAHRNRPLIYDGRTVISFCQPDIDFLPATQVISRFPVHLGRDSDEARLARAAAWLDVREHRRTVAAMLDTLRTLDDEGMRRDKVIAWLHQHPVRGHAA